MRRRVCVDQKKRRRVCGRREEKRRFLDSVRERLVVGNNQGGGLVDCG